MVVQILSSHFGYRHKVVVFADLSLFGPVLEAVSSECLPHGHLVRAFLLVLVNVVVVLSEGEGVIVVVAFVATLVVSRQSVLVDAAAVVSSDVIAATDDATDTAVRMRREVLGRRGNSGQHFLQISMHLVSAP